MFIILYNYNQKSLWPYSLKPIVQSLSPRQADFLLASAMKRFSK